MATENAAQAQKKPNIFRRLGKFFKDCRAEMKKVTWPSFQQVVKNTGIVLACCAVVLLFVFGIDTLLGTIFKSL
ncbi:MAG: preprotein translocase subunit SecE [Clostridia bacterium]|nr:preprotein translocase subunit SecE [Clostridia bacterium]